VQKQVTCTYRLQCPHLNKLHEINITYAQVPMCGTTKEVYKKVESYCSEDSKCNLKDQYGRCPVYLKAPEQPHF